MPLVGQLKQFWQQQKKHSPKEIQPEWYFGLFLKWKRTVKLNVVRSVHQVLIVVECPKAVLNTTLLLMITAAKNQTQDVLILSPMPHPLGHMLQILILANCKEFQPDLLLFAKFH